MNVLHYKKLIHNEVHSWEAIALLELVKVLERKYYSISTRLVVVPAGNREACKNSRKH